jgi:hypothetical protein
MAREGRVQVRCIFERNFDGDRFADMHTIWFDSMPVMVVRDGGRGGADFRSRMVTNAALFSALCEYIRQKLQPAQAGDDLVDPDKLLYPEELFNFYGGIDMAAELGYAVEPKVEGFMLIPHVHRIIPQAPDGHILVQAKPEVGEMPQYLRRNGSVLQRVRALTDEELAGNARVGEHSRATGYTWLYWYVQADAPAGAKVVRI